MKHIAKARLCRPGIAGFKDYLGPLLLFLLAALRTPAAETMRVGIESFSEPISFVQADGRPGGFAVDLLEAVAREMDFSTQLVTGGWDEIFPRFRRGEIDVVLSVAYTPDRDAFIDYAVPHLRLEGTVFVRRGAPPLRDARELASMRVATLRDSFSHGYLRARGWDRHLIFVPNFHAALREVDEGRCDAVAAIGIIGNHVLRKEGFPNVVASSVALPDFTMSLHMGVAAGDAHRLAILNEGLARVRANGLYDRIYEQWIGPLEPRRLRLGEFKPVLIPAIAIGVALAGALWWQRRLNKRIAEQAGKLRQSEERLRHVLEGSQDAFWDWDVSAGRIERSERWAAMLGYAPTEISPALADSKALVHPDDLQHFDSWRARLITGIADRYDIEYRLRAKSGEWHWMLDRGKVVARSPDGRALRMAGTLTDITARKETESALMESQALLKRSAQLLEQSQKTAHVGGWESDLRTGRVYWTHETFRIHETTPEEFTPTRDSIYIFYVPESRQRLEAAVERAIRDGTPFALELQIVTAKQRRIFVQTAGVAEKENGAVVKLYGSFRDITAEKIAEEERESLQLKMLEAQKLESLGVLAGGIAHDFNNLLTIILANASFVRGGATTNSGEHLAHIEAAARRAADLCRQMLAYAGKGSFVVEPLDLGALVRDTTHLIHVSISKKARLQIDLATSLPFVEGDASQLRQVVMNLVINASEALGEAPGEIRIATSVGRPDSAAAGVQRSFDLPPGDCTCLEVSDTGAGMSPVTLTRIFDPFFTTKFTGRGLGLAAVLGIVRAHKGALTVESTPGHGSRFRVYLPPCAPLAAREAPLRPAPPSLKTGGTILVADDEPVVLQTAAALLQHLGYQTVVAADGHEAVARFRAEPRRFFAVLLDLTMPGLDGAEVLRIIRALNPTVPALVMSGFSEQDLSNRFRGLGRVGIMRKPFTQEMLISRIAEVTAR